VRAHDIFFTMPGRIKGKRDDGVGRLSSTSLVTAFTKQGRLHISPSQSQLGRSDSRSAVLYQESQLSEDEKSFPALDDVRPGHPSMPLLQGGMRQSTRRRRETQRRERGGGWQSENDVESSSSSVMNIASQSGHRRQGGPQAVHSAYGSFKEREGSDESEDSDKKLIRASDADSTVQEVESSVVTVVVAEPEEEMPDPSFLDEFGSDLALEEEVDEDELYFKTTELQRDLSEVRSKFEDLDEEEEADELSRNASFMSVRTQLEDEEEIEDYVCDKAVRRESSSSPDSLLGDTRPLYKFNVVGRRKKIKLPVSRGSGDLPTYTRPVVPVTYPEFNFSAYLKDKLGKALVECLTEIAIMKPHDPVAYLANWLKMLPKVDKERRKFERLRDFMIWNYYSPKEETPRIRLNVYQPKQTVPGPKYNLKDEADTSSFLKLLEDVGVTFESDTSPPKEGEEEVKEELPGEGIQEAAHPEEEENIIPEQEGA